MEIKQYAPVIIPTLNRYDHFRQCLESLERCTGADKTDVYIGLDYPPSEKYVEGWKQINEYLKSKEITNGFKKLIVIRHTENCGVGGPKSNSNQLRAIVNSKYDCHIFTEDDNIFSPNFLEYINKGLEKYKDDPTVFAICGYCEPQEYKFADNNHYYHRTNFSAWGYGTWIQRRSIADKDIDNGLFQESFNIKNILKIYRYGRILFTNYCGLIARKKGIVPKVDRNYSNYLQLKDYKVVVPTISKVRNIGWDELGNSFRGKKMIGVLVKQKEMYESQIVDMNSRFNYEGDPHNYEEYNNKLASKIGADTISLIKVFRIFSSFTLQHMKHRIKGE